MRPDLIITHIKSCYYPIWEKTLRRYRYFFGKVIIYFDEKNRFPYYDHFIHESMKDMNITFLDPTYTDWATEDWRNHATNEMLDHSKSDWIASIEQDWFCWDWNKLLSACERQMEGIASADIFGWLNPTNAPYIHPSFFFAKREVIEEANRDFFPHPEVNGGDHFSMITWKAKELGRKIVGLEVGEVKPESLAFHLGGVNQNYLDGINTGVFHRPEIFYVYNWWSMKYILPLEFVKQLSEFAKRCITADSILKKMFPNINPETSEWRIFFNDKEKT